MFVENKLRGAWRKQNLFQVFKIFLTSNISRDKGLKTVEVLVQETKGKTAKKLLFRYGVFVLNGGYTGYQCRCFPLNSFVLHTHVLRMFVVGGFLTGGFRCCETYVSLVQNKDFSAKAPFTRACTRTNLWVWQMGVAT